MRRTFCCEIQMDVTFTHTPESLSSVLWHMKQMFIQYPGWCRKSHSLL